jgi:hypothetical protein
MTATVKQAQTGQYATKEIAGLVQRALGELNKNWLALLLRYVEGCLTKRLERSGLFERNCGVAP